MAECSLVYIQKDSWRCNIDFTIVNNRCPGLGSESRNVSFIVLISTKLRLMTETMAIISIVEILFVIKGFQLLPLCSYLDNR